MRSIRQLIRQPLKTLAGILLTAIAVCVLCIGFSQTLAAADTSRKLLETYMTVALPAGLDSKEDAQWIDDLVAQHPEIIKSDLRHGLATAYIPSLIPDNYTEHKSPDQEFVDPMVQPDTLAYGGAMLEITLKEISANSNSDWEILEDGTAVIHTDTNPGIIVTMTGDVIRAVGLADGYHDPAGYTVKLTLLLPDLESLDALSLQPGERYLVYGDDYYDLDWVLRDNLADIMVWRHEESLPEWDMSTFIEYDADAFSYTITHKCLIGDLYHGLTAWEMELFRTVRLTLEDQSSLPQYEVDDIYAVPTIAHLDGTVEEFLASSDGAIWQRTLDDIEINSHAFPVIGTNNLQSVAEFVLGRADIAEGRSFSDAEIAGGTNVCVISSYLAQDHGLSVGDTIDLQYFLYDFDSPYQKLIRDGKGIINSIGYSYFSPTMGRTAATEYTIIGLYELDSPWGSSETDPYSFNVNTIFVPQQSVSGSMDYASHGQFLTLVIHSDMLLPLQELTVAADKGGIFEYFDNGYNAVAATLKDFEAAASRILPIGIIVYCIVMLLFLFLFPAREQRTLAQMDSIGAGHFRRIRHLLTSTFGILIPGSILGTTISIYMWDYVAAALKEYMQTDIAVELDVRWLWGVAAIQVLIVLAAISALGIYMSKNTNPMRRK